MVQGLGTKSGEGCLKEMEMFNLEKRKLRINMITVFQYFKVY